jgi:5-methylcytosine-specific restriction protein B
MEELRNLQQIYSLAAGKFNQYDGNDFVLPLTFKEQVKEINGNSVTYNNYSAIIQTKGFQRGFLNIYLPNQWFYMASYFTDFYNELIRYKKYALKVTTKERLKVLDKGSLSVEEENSLQSLDLNDTSKNNLRLFITDYNWWHGAKTIDRGDFYVSPILACASLVNASQSYVVDLCVFLADKQNLVRIIIEGVDKIAINKLKSSNQHHSIYTSYLTALRTKPFMLLAGISGTGKSRIVRKLAQATVTEELQRANGYTGGDFANDRWTLHSPVNFELIQVKPNWHNSMDVIGYLSNIPSPHYVFTPFIEFIVKAWQHPEVPFFLCLDEMNLAPVEEYFAEFLSAIESRSFEGEEYLTDPIIKPFNSFGEDVAKTMVNTLFPNFTAGDTESAITKVIKHFRTKGLTLPKNLIVIGTVNMDETTFSFSRKVLDRAMSVEMNEVNYDSFLTDTTDDDLKAIVEAFEQNDDADLNALLVDRHIEAREIIDDLGDDARFTIDYLKRINALLEGTPFKLGYRAANEALIYLQASQEFGQTDRIAALDNFTLMKILSRIEGDETKLKITDSEADKERIAKAEVNVDEAKQYGDLNILTALRHIITNQLGEQDKLQSVKKIDSMLSQLKRDHFVSFWN